MTAHAYSVTVNVCMVSDSLTKQTTMNQDLHRLPRGERRTSLRGGILSVNRLKVGRLQFFTDVGDLLITLKGHFHLSE